MVYTSLMRAFTVIKLFAVLVCFSIGASVAAESPREPLPLTVEEKLGLAEARILTLVAEKDSLQKQIELLQAQLIETQRRSMLGAMFSRYMADKGADGCEITISGEWANCPEPPAEDPTAQSESK